MERNRFEKFLLEELTEAYYTARKGKRHTVDEHRFEINAQENIMDLAEAILCRQYHPNRGVAFIIQDPVTREIVAAPFRDRVVHHFLYNICAEWWDWRFSPDSYSCRKGKGTLYAQERLQEHIRRVLKESSSGRAFVVKLDLQGYFMSLEHEKLYAQVCWGLDQQFYGKKGKREIGIRCREGDVTELYKTVKYLWRQVIFDEPMKGIAIRGRKSDWRLLPDSKSLFHQPKGRGIVIGNLTSQLLSNIFMDKFDRYVFYDLGYKHYGRYVDDFFILVPMERKEQLLRDVDLMEKFLRQEMGLTLHPKKRYMQDVSHGVPFVGAVIYKNAKVPGKRIRRNCFAAAYRLATNGEGDLDGFVSRIGSIKYLDSQKFIKQVFDSFGWENGD